MSNLISRIVFKLKNELQVFRDLSIYRYVFSAHYQTHNIARLQHLESLGLDLSNKSVVEFGAGVGDHTLYYLLKNCQVLPTDARPELVDFMRRRLGVKADVVDVERDLDKIRNMPHRDIIHCYGLLYHINNPDTFLDAIKDKSDLLLLETCVSADNRPDEIHLTRENKNKPTQASSGTGCRPTRRWIWDKLKANYKYVYAPRTQPKHAQFPLDWTKDFVDGQLIRAVFIASRDPIDSPNLLSELPMVYEGKEKKL